MAASFGFIGDPEYSEAVSPNLGPVSSITFTGDCFGAVKEHGTIATWGILVGPTPSGLSNVVRLVFGSNHAYVLKADGSLVGWGDNSRGQLATPVGATNIVAVEAGPYHTVALRDDGSVFTWGIIGRSSNATTPAGLTNIVAVAAFFNVDMALRNDGTLAIWGDAPDESFDTNAIAQATNIVAIHSFTGAALNADGSVVRFATDQTPGVELEGVLQQPDGVLLWGLNGTTHLPDVIDYCGTTNGAVMIEPFASLTVPQRATIFPLSRPNRTGFAITFPGTFVPTDVTNIVSIATRDDCFVALDSAGYVQAWGSNWFGRLDVPTNLSNAVAVAVASDHALALLADGSVQAWGSNAPPTADLTNVVMIAAGRIHDVCLRADGTVLVVSTNSSQRQIPVGATNIVSIAAGLNHTLALRADGTLFEWPKQSGSPADHTNVVAMAGGNGFSLAVRSNGLITAWGVNSYGQLNTPLIGPVSKVAAGDYHSVALTPNGTIAAWGAGGLDTTYMPKTGSPNFGQSIVSPFLTNAFAIVAASFQSIALSDSIFAPPISANIVSVGLNVTAPYDGNFTIQMSNDGVVWTNLREFSGSSYTNGFFVSELDTKFRLTPAPAMASAQLRNGGVVGITLIDGGKGYVEPPIVSIFPNFGGRGSGAFASATISNGAVDGFTIHATGAGYTNAFVAIEPPPPVAAVISLSPLYLNIGSQFLNSFLDQQQAETSTDLVHWSIRPQGFSADVTLGQALFFRIQHVPLKLR